MLPIFLYRFKLIVCLEHLQKQLHKSHDGWGWKRPLEIIKSNLSAEAGLPRTGCTR